MLTEQEDIGNHTVEHFKNVFPKHQNNDPPIWEVISQGDRIRQEHKELLAKPYSAEEVKEALFFSIGSCKSPGPDGYGSHFFKSAWNLVGKDVTTVVLSLRRQDA